MTAGRAGRRAVQLCAYCTWLHGFCAFMAHSCAQDAAGIMKKDKFKEKIQKRLTEMRKNVSISALTKTGKHSVFWGNHTKT